MYIHDFFQNFLKTFLVWLHGDFTSSVIAPDMSPSKEHPVALGRRRNQWNANLSSHSKKLSKGTSRLHKWWGDLRLHTKALQSVPPTKYAKPIELWKRKWGKKNKRWESSPPMADGVAEARGRGGGGEGKRSAVAAHPHCSSTSSSSLIRRQTPPPSLGMRCESNGGEKDEGKE